MLFSGVNQRSAVDGQWLVFLFLVDSLTCRASVTNIQNSEAFVKCFGAFSWVVKEEKLPLLKEKKLPG